MEGLEAVELKLSEVMEDNENFRYDPEYFNKTAQAAFIRLKHHRRFVDLVKNGYRVIYENTRAIEREEGIAAGLPFFLQAADISTPFISDQNMICVSPEDWLRYPKGKIIHGEVLIEVKGQAEKVAIVPDGFPLNTLVTGTVYKMSTIEELDKYLLVSYLTCRYGQALKNRLKTNLLVSFISKSDLYRLPVPNFNKDFKETIKNNYLFAENLHKQSKLQDQRGVEILLTVLGLENWRPAEPLTYQLSVKDAFIAERIDAEHFQPKYQALHERLANSFELITLKGTVTKGVTAPYADDGTVPIIRSGDLTSLDNEDKFLLAEPGAEIFQLERGDVLISSIGFGSIGKVQVFDKPGVYGTVSEVTVIRQKRLNPYYLSFYLRSIAGQLQIERYITGATGQLHLYPRDVSKFFVPIIPETEQIKFEEIAKKAETARLEARTLLERSKRAVEIAIEESEEAGHAYLKGGR